MKDLKLQSNGLIWEEDGLSVSIVHNYNEGDFENYYRIFELRRPVDNVGLIGVESLDNFAIKIDRKINRDFSFSLYLDGLSISQENGIVSLNDIEENYRRDYNKHNQFICRHSSGNGSFFVDRFSQLSSKNRKFIFTDIPNTGINEILLGDISKSNRIEIYFWSESEIELPNLLSRINPRSMKIGAGEETNKGYKKGKGLKNPWFLGKLMFVYVNQKDINLNKSCKIPKDAEFDFDDPMDLVPKP